jgi:hypothetical protein
MTSAVLVHAHVQPHQFQLQYYVINTTPSRRIGSRHLAAVTADRAPLS